MKKLISVIPIAIILLSLFSCKQPEIPQQNLKCFNDIIASNDNNLVCVGYSGTPSNKYSAVIQKRDTSNNALWVKQLSDKNVNSFFKVMQTSQSDYIAVGYAYNTDRTQPNLLMAMYDDNGNQKWVRVVDNIKSAGLSIAAASDTTFVVAGYAHNQTNNARYAKCYLVNYNGNIIDEKSYFDNLNTNETLVNSEFTDVVIADNNIYLVGNINPTFNKSNSFVMKCNQQGDSLWTKVKTYSTITAITHTSDNKIAVCGNTNDNNVFFWTLSNNGNTATYTVFEKQGIVYAADIVETSNRNFFIVGCIETTINDKDAYLIKINPDGTYLIENTFATPEPEILFSCTKAIGDKYYLGGLSNTPESKFLIIKTNLSGDNIATYNID
ncbi:MAG: hypothetical protein PHP31_09440 [Lentimicrobiaceae bacterium]|nr:hypothetical protein [Lentimicrobiaceae bacterium]